MLPILMLAFGGLGGGTIHVDGGFTSSVRDLDFPTPPPGAGHISFQINHEVRTRFGHETNGVGLWTADAWISAGWALRDAGGPPLRHARISRFFSTGGVAEPFDGTLDFAGLSGGTDAFADQSSAAPIVLDITQIANLTIDTRARSDWQLTVEFGENLWWLNQTESSSEVPYEWLP